MFKETIGFDVDLFKFGVAVKIEDIEPTEKPAGSLYSDLDGMEHKWNNMSGTYLVKESSSTVLRLTSVTGKEIKFHIRHFTGCQPRMTIQILE